jgi:hypothetical protein
VTANAATLGAPAVLTMSAAVGPSAVTLVRSPRRHYRRTYRSRTWRTRPQWNHQGRLYRPYYLDSPYYYSTSFDGYPYASRYGYPFRPWDRGALIFRR